VTPRVALLGFFHESNTFASTRATEQQIRSLERYGDEIRAEHAGAGTVMAGYLDAAPQSWETVPLAYTELVPCGPLEPAAAARVRQVLLSQLREHGPFDAILLCLHGAAVSVDEHDLDGALLAAIREEVGPDPLIGVTLDLHANVTDRIVDNADVLAGYRTNPHVDARDRAMEVARAVADALRDGVRPTTVDVAVPTTITILAQGTGVAPMAPLMAAVEEAAQVEGVLTSSLFEGFPWADTPDIGMRVVITTRGDVAQAGELASDIAQRCWAARKAFVQPALVPRDAFRDLEEGTTLVLDVGDNIGGGATGDSTYLLSTAIAVGETSAVAIVVDPAAASLAAGVSVGETVELVVGQPALQVRARLLATSDGTYEDIGPTHVGHRYFDAGLTAALELETGQHLVVCSRSIMPSSAQQLRSLGLDPRSYRVVCAKGVHSPLAGYGAYVDHVRWADTPGVTSNDLSTLSYQYRPVPLFPFEDSSPNLAPRRPS